MLVNKTVEVLVEEEEAGADEGCVGQLQLTLGHVGHLKTQQRTLTHQERALSTKRK